MRILFFAIFFFCAHARAAEWYVRPSPGEYGVEDGRTYQTAFDGFKAVIWGPNGVKPGDTLRICGTFAPNSASSTDYRMVSINSGFGGTLGSPVTLDGDCRGSGNLARAVLDGGGVTAHGIRTFKATDLRIRNLEIRNFASIGIVLSDFSDTGFTDSRRITIEETVHIHNIGSTGISSVGTDNTIIGVEIENIGSDGIVSSGRNLRIDGVRIRNVSTADYLGDCIQISGDIDGTEITNAYCDHSSVDSKQCIVASNVTGPASWRIDGLQCYFSPGGNSSIGVYLEGHATIQRSYIFGAAQFGIAVAARENTSAYILNNVINASGQSCIEGSRGGIASLSASLIVAIGNSCYGNSSFGINFNSSAESRAVNDNIVVGSHSVGISKGISNTAESGNSIFGATIPVAIGITPTKPGSGTRASAIGQ